MKWTGFLIVAVVAVLIGFAADGEPITTTLAGILMVLVLVAAAVETYRNW